MIDKSRESNLEFLFYTLAFGFALSLRLLRLGELPLGDDEARWALQGLNLAKGLGSVIGPQPAYVVLTGLVFFLFQASNFAARLVPALFGAALSVLPFSFRDRLGRKPAIVLAFIISFDPGFLALSRLAGGPILAICAALFAWAALRSGNPRAAGIWVGVALLSGPVLWPGLIGLGIAYGLWRGFSGAAQPDSSSKPELPLLPMPSDRKTWLSLVAAAVGTYVILGSFFLIASGGLSAGLASIPEYFGGWFNFSNVSGFRLMIGLTIYELTAVLLALMSLVRGILKQEKLVIALGIWLLIALVFALIYPSRQFSDLGWALVPLLVLASIELSRHISPIQNGKLETIGMAVFTAAILMFAVLNYFAIALVPLDQPALQLRWWILLGAIGLLAVSLGMVAFGWSVPTAVQGGTWGTLSVLFIFTLATSMASGSLRSYPTLEMWPSGAYTGQVNILLEQMNDLSRWKTGVNSTLDVTLAGVDSPALLWALRDWPVTVLPDANLFGSAPALLIASDQVLSAEIESNYRGQDLSWSLSPMWDQGLFGDWMRWSILHEFPKSDEKIILWVRSDVFVDSQNSQ